MTDCTRKHTHTHMHSLNPPLLCVCVCVHSRWLGVVPRVMAHFGRLFDEAEETLSVEKAMELLEK